MLIQFNVSNFMSIRDEVVLSTVPSSDKQHLDYLIKKGKDSVLPSIAIYGANASGKSNIIKAMTVAILLVRNSHLKQINDPTGIIPFLLDKDSRNKKTRMDFIFVYEGIKYTYGFTADNKRIYEEYLLEYKTAKPTLVFERNDIDKYKYTNSKYEKELKKCENQNSDNKLFLSTATQWNCESTRNAYLWFTQNIDTYTPMDLSARVLDILDKNKDNKQLKEFVLNFLKHADINISDYEFKSRIVNEVKEPFDIFNDEIKNQIKSNTKEFKITTRHTVEENGQLNSYDLDYMLESVGTRSILAYAIELYFALQTGKTVVIDEIDNSLHPMLVRFIVKIFNDLSINKNGSQLIFVTHDVSLLDLDLLRRDQIYFVEKDNKNGISDLYSLADYSPRKDENIQKGYMLGRYGAIPVVDEGFGWRE